MSRRIKRWAPKLLWSALVLGFFWRVALPQSSAYADLATSTTPTNPDCNTISLNGQWSFKLAADWKEAERVARFYSMGLAC